MKYLPYLRLPNGEELYLLDRDQPILYSRNFTKIRSQATVYPTIQSAVTRINLLTDGWFIRTVK